MREIGVRDVTCGERVVITLPANIYEATLGDDVFVGPFCEIQRGVVIGDRTRVQSHTFICELVTVGQDDRSRWESTSIGDRVSVGSNVTILPVSICADVIIGAGGVVTRDITEPGTYAGNPARRMTT